jgi:hypothetical protein
MRDHASFALNMRRARPPSLATLRVAPGEHVRLRLSGLGVAPSVQRSIC